MQKPSPYDFNSAIARLPKRPRGNRNTDRKFKTLEITSNHYKIFLYKVEIEPKITENDRTNRSRIYNVFRPKLDVLFYNPVCSGNVIYTTKKPKWQDSKTSISQTFNEIKYTLSPKFIKSVKFRSNDPVHQKMQLMFLNNLLRDSCRKLKFVEIGKTRRLFDMKNKVDIQDLDVSLTRGSIANFCRLEHGLFLKIDAFIRAIPTRTVLDYINDYVRDNPHVERQERRRILNDRLSGKTIMGAYGNNTCWIVQAIRFTQKPSQIFLHGVEQNISVQQYYLNRYKLKLKCPKQPVIQVKTSKESIFVLPQFCVFTDTSLMIQQEHGKRRIVAQTKQSFDQRIQQIKSFRQSLNKIQTEETAIDNLSKKLQINIEKDFCKVKAKKLQIPEIQFGNTSVPRGHQSSFRLIDQPLFDSVQRLNVAVIHFNNANTELLVKVFNETPKKLNLKFCYKLHHIKDCSSKEILTKLKQRMQQLAKLKENNIFLVIYPSTMKESYSNLKQYCCNELGILTQFCVDTSLTRKESQSIVTKILLQMSAKIGNVLWNPKLEGLTNKKIMIVGLSCGVSQGKVGKRISYCASLNQTVSRFYSNSIIQNVDTPIAQHMEIVLANCLKAYADHNRMDVPEEIIIVKDGVSHGQIQGVVECQIPSCLSAIRNTQDDIKMTYIILDKRPTQKFFSCYQNRLQNVRSGTLINQGLIEQNQDSFYLVSQNTNQGTIVPTYYQIIYSDSELQRGVIEEILFSQCFNYCNWSGSIKIPSINQYAKKYSDFVSTHLKGKVPDYMNKELFYI